MQVAGRRFPEIGEPPLGIRQYGSEFHDMPRIVGFREYSALMESRDAQRADERRRRAQH